MNGRSPFIEWITRLRDKKAKARIGLRLRQLESGNFGDAKSVGAGLMELRIDLGAGYRVYCRRHGELWVLLLCGGDKSTQTQDIVKAKELWEDWKRRQP